MKSAALPPRLPPPPIDVRHGILLEGTIGFGGGALKDSGWWGGDDQLNPVLFNAGIDALYYNRWFQAGASATFGFALGPGTSFISALAGVKVDPVPNRVRLDFLAEGAAHVIYPGYDATVVLPYLGGRIGVIFWNRPYFYGPWFTCGRDLQSETVNSETVGGGTNWSLMLRLGGVVAVF